jgi:hypothetical protein
MTREEITITGDAVSDQLTMSRVDFIRLREADRALAVAAEREAICELADNLLRTSDAVTLIDAIRARGSK